MCLVSQNVDAGRWKLTMAICAAWMAAPRDGSAMRLFSKMVGIEFKRFSITVL
jgi:hypothetical protein